jgi:hypothetical protein
MCKVQIKKSTRKEKKLMAIFTDCSDNTKTTTHFGATGYSDFTIHGDKNRKQRYINRHRKNENWNDQKSAGSLSLYLLWNKPTLKESIADYKKRFNLT